jgi:hypothetical protein
MFENLDDPAPPNPGPLDTVTARGRRMRLQRRVLAGAVGLLVLAVGITSATALQSRGHDKVVVANPPTTSPVEETTTIPKVTSTTTPRATSTSTPGVVSTVAASTSTTATTQPPHDPHDFSMVSVTYTDNPIALPAGTTKPITYTVTNNGSWAVELPSICYGPTLWARPATSGWAPYTEGIWPQPYPTRGSDALRTGCTPTPSPLAAGASTIWFDQIIAGYRDAAGNVMPSPPGFTSYRPTWLPQCSQPCAPDSGDSVAVTIEAPAWPPPASLYTIDVKTMHPQAASGAAANVEMTYTNGLAFAVRMPLFGPCWKVKSGTATVDCSGTRPAVIIGARETVDLVGTIWARTGFVATGTPLAAGTYRLDLGDLQGSAYSIGDPLPYLTVS